VKLVPLKYGTLPVCQVLVPVPPYAVAMDEVETRRVPSNATGCPVENEAALVPPLAIGRMPVKRFTPIEEVATTLPVASTPRRELLSPVNQAVVSVESVVDDWFTLMRFENVVDAEKMLLPEKVLLFERRVDDAAETVIEVPTGKLVPLMVPREPVRRLVPIEVVAMILLF